jgi:hypothetical protein
MKEKLLLIFGIIVATLKVLTSVLVPITIGGFPFFLVPYMDNRFWYLFLLVTVPIAVWLSRKFHQMWFYVPPMTLADLTEEEAEIILNHIYPFPNWIKSEITHKYCPYDESLYSDGEEYYLMTFQGIVKGNEVERIRVFIYPNLDCDIDYSRPNEDGVEMPQGRLPVRGQKNIQESFKEFGFE